MQTAPQYYKVTAAGGDSHITALIHVAPFLFSPLAPEVTDIPYSRVPASAGSPGRREEVFWRLLLHPYQPVPPGAIRPLCTMCQMSGDPPCHRHHVQGATGVVLLPCRSLDHAGLGQGDSAQLQQVTGRRKAGTYMGCLPHFFVVSIPEELRSVWVCLFIMWD